MSPALSAVLAGWITCLIFDNKVLQVRQTLLTVRDQTHISSIEAFQGDVFTRQTFHGASNPNFTAVIGSDVSLPTLMGIETAT